MKSCRSVLLASLLASSSFFLASSALAQDEATPPLPPVVTTPNDPPPAAAPATPAATPAPEPEKKIHASVAIERVGGLSYSNISGSDSNDSLGVAGYVIGGPSVNPDTSPRLGVDAIFGNNLTLGAGLAGGTYSLKSGSGDRSATDHLSLFVLAPRIGYRIPISKNWDITPRGVVTVEGGSLATDDDKSKTTVVALALGAEGVLAYRATSSFNLLAGLGFDHTVAGSATQSSDRTSSNGVVSRESSSSSIDGSIFTMQVWIGIGGYL